MSDFKKTELGAVPLSWNIVKISDIAQTKSGGTPSTKRQDYWDGDVPWINSGALDNCLINKPNKYITKKGLENSSAKLLPKNTVVIALTGATTGKVGLLEFECSTNQSVVGIMPTKDYNTTFLFYNLIYSRRRVLSFKSGAAQPHINKGVIDNLLVILPPLVEQQSIAHILSKVKSIIESQEKIIQMTTKLQKALMQKLFMEGLKGETQKDTEIGRLPKSWAVRKMGEIALIERGKFSHRPRNDPEYYSGNIPFIQTGDITNSSGRIKTHSQTLNDRGLSVSRVFPKGTIVITIAANIGDTAILEYDCAFPDSIIGITSSEQVNSVYLEYYLRTQKDVMDMLAPRGTQKNINIQFLKPWLIPVPSLQEQKEIADLLQTVDRKIEQVKRKHAILSRLFKSMLHHLMTGQVRVKDVRFS